MILGFYLYDVLHYAVIASYWLFIYYFAARWYFEQQVTLCLVCFEKYIAAR